MLKLGRLRLYWLLLIFWFLLSSCGGQTTSTVPVATTTAPTLTASNTPITAGDPISMGYPFSLTDDNKRTVKIAAKPMRIVSLAPSTTELAYALGLGERIVAVDAFSNYPDDAAKKEKVGDFNTVSLEKVVATTPDLVLAAGITSKQLIDTMQARNLTVLVLNPTNLAGVVSNIILLGQATSTDDKARAVASIFQAKLDEVAAKVKTVSSRPRVYYELDPTLFTIGPGSFIDDILQKAGGQNIVTDASNPYPQLNQEAVISKDPQVILLGDDSGEYNSPEKILTRAGWSSISAIKNKRVIAVSANLVNRSGPRAALGVENVAKALYPELFK